MKKNEPAVPIDLSHLFTGAKYMNKWVALSHYEPDYKVITFGNDLDVVIKRAIKKGCSKPVMIKVTKELAEPCCFGCLIAIMNPDVVISKPYAGNPEKVKEIRKRLIDAT